MPVVALEHAAQREAPGQRQRAGELEALAVGTPFWKSSQKRSVLGSSGAVQVDVELPLDRQPAKER